MPASITTASVMSFEQAVRNIVQASFPSAHPDVSAAKIIDGTAISTAETANLTDKASGERIFTMGISRWCGSRTVGA